MEQLKKGYIVQVGLDFYEIRDVEDLRYVYSDTFAAGIAVVREIRDLSPEKEYLHFISHLGIDGGIEVQIYFPKDVPRGGPKNATIRLNRFQAPYMRPKKIGVGFAVRQEWWPSLNIYNPYSTSMTADVWFYGQRLLIVGHSHKAGEKYTELVDWTGVRRGVPV